MPGFILSRLMSPLYVPHSLSAVCAFSCHIARLACPSPPRPCLLSGLSTVSDRQRTLMLPRCAARTNYISISVFHLPLATCRKGARHRVPQGGRSPGVHYASVFPARNGSKSARKMCSVAGTEITFINTYRASRGVRPDSTLAATGWAAGFVCSGSAIE